MDRLRTTLITAFVIAILFAPAASAQGVAAQVAVISGNGQMICPSCADRLFIPFYPMVVKVTDASGNPIVNKTVNWKQISGPLDTQAPRFETVTFTDRNGLSAARLYVSQDPQFATINTNTYFLQSVIRATVDNAFVNFTETQALTPPDRIGQQIIDATLDTSGGTVLTGFAGRTGTIPIQVHVAGYGFPVPNVSVRILSPVSPDPKAPLPSASCETGPGADPGSVLTDASGNATCRPVFGKPFFQPGAVSVSGPVSVIVGGLDPAEFDQAIIPDQPLPGAVWYRQFPDAIQLVITPVTPSYVTVISGNNQSVDPGRSSDPLVVQVTDLSGTVSIGSTSVTWTVSPAGAATLNPSVTTTDAQGKTQTTVTFAANAARPITVTASLTNYSGISTTFALSTKVLISSFNKESGDLQTVQAGQNFGMPLSVRVIGTNLQPLSSQQVSFLVSGSATLSDFLVATDTNGVAQVKVKAGATPGAVKVTALVGNFSLIFTLTIIPPGPILSSSSFYSSGGATRIGALSPCSLVTVVTSGLAPNVQGLVFNTNAFGPWATTLAFDTVTVNSVAAPVYSVGNVNGVEQITFQVPCETVPGSSVPILINVGGGIGTVNFPVQAATPGIFETVMSDGVRRAVVIRPDGTFVSVQNPARRGEVVRVFVTGMGPTAPAMVTGAFPYAGVDSLVLGEVIAGVNNAGARVVTARVSPNLIGVYEVALQVPDDAPTGNDVVLSVAVNAPGEVKADGTPNTRYSNGSKLPIQQ